MPRYTFYFFTLFLLAPTFASAHAFGAQYNLPLPAMFYIVGGSLALLLSFVLLLLSPPEKRETAALPERQKALSPMFTRRLVTLLRGGSFLALLLTIAIGLLGSRNPLFNFATASFWIYFLLGFAYISVFIRGLWDVVNPFERGPLPFFSRASRFDFPRWAHHLPALILYIFIIWAELLSGASGADPFLIALALIAYLIYARAVIAFYGKEVWREHFDVFGVFFRAIGIFAPFKIMEDGVFVRKSAAETAGERASGFWILLFILSILAFTAFDGYRETAPYVNALIQFSGSIPPRLFELAVFVLFPILFLSIYAVSIYFVRLLSRSQLTFSSTLYAYAYSLVPIAVVYHAAHYFTLLLTEGQRIVILISDPLGLGMNIFGTRNYQINSTVLSPDIIWYIQLGLIVAGHIAALYVSHLITHRLAATRMKAFLAELPLVAVMVFYTAFGLWILSQPFAL